VVAAACVRLGWISTDEGVLAHSAERVLRGELPHRDFDDVYTGGLAIFDAAVFRVLGTRLIALRVPLVVAFALWSGTVYAIARRFTSTTRAALVVLLTVVWTVPCYPAAMPSWYSLFLYTAGTAALCRYVEDRRRRWLVIAGVAGGMAITIKVTGLYYVAAVLLLLVFLEQQDADAASRADRGTRAAGRPYRIGVAGMLLVFVAALARLILRLDGGAGPLLHFVAPSAALVALLIWRDWGASGTATTRRRFERLIRMVAPFLLSTALPVAAFLTPYILADAVGPLLHGVFILPQRRFQFVSLAPGNVHTIGWAIPMILLLAAPAAWWRGTRSVIVTIGLLALLVPIVASGGASYRALWQVAEHIDWIVVLVGVWLLASTRATAGVPQERLAQLWLLLAMSALSSLVRFPFAGSYYLLYFAPLAALASLAILTTRPGGAGPVPVIVATFLIVVGITCADTRRFSPSGDRWIPLRTFVPLAGSRTGIEAPRDDSAAYARTIALLQQHSPPDGYIYAGPDLPQMYFLADRRDPTRTLYDFFDDTAAHDATVLQAIDAHQVTAVAINLAITFSPPIDVRLRNALRERFPDSTVIDPFVVRWRWRAPTRTAMGLGPRANDVLVSSPRCLRPLDAHCGTRFTCAHGSPPHGDVHAADPTNRSRGDGADMAALRLCRPPPSE